SFTAVRVTDSGVGMKPEDCSKLFGENHFTKSGTQNEKGTGLGLLLCKEYIEANGGTIEVSSELNKGTTFAFTLKNSDNRTQKK
ncbi:MAG: ATP-binding protein, partial [Cytophagales bacterium]